MSKLGPIIDAARRQAAKAPPRWQVHPGAQQAFMEGLADASIDQCLTETEDIWLGIHKNCLDKP